MKKIKKLLSIVLAIMLILSAVPLGAFTLTASAETKYEEGYTYTIENGEATITNAYEVFGSDIIIPSILGGYPVTNIGEAAFWGCGFTSITIPDSVVNIGSSAFSNSDSLTNVSIGNGVVNIEQRAFAECQSLTNITIPYGVVSIGNSAFYNCTELAEITISDSVMYIGEDAFYNTAFYNNETNWTNDLLYINNHLIMAKQNVSGEVQIKEGTLTIADNAFYRCANSITGLTFSDSVISIGDKAFSYLSAENIILPKNLKNIGEEAFFNSYIRDISIPADVEYIGMEALASPYIRSINVSYENSNYCSVDGVLFNKNMTKLIQYPGDKKDTSYTIPDGVTEIGEWAFSSTGYELESVVIGDSVTVIDDHAFHSNDIISVTIGENVTSIGDYAFANCWYLTNVTIGDSVKIIGESAFESCDLSSSIIIPDSVTSIGDLAFAGCEKLNDITISKNLNSIGSQAFWGTAYHNDENNWEDGVLYIDNYLLSAWNNITNEYFSGDCYIKENTVLLADRAFMNCTNLTSVSIPDSVINMGIETFWDCENLTSVTIPNNITDIGYRCFYNCNSLTSITIPKNVINIGEHAFAECDTLENVNMTNSVKNIKAYAFSNCDNIVNFTIPNSVVTIEESAFADCDNLVKIKIPSSVTAVGARAFQDCESIKEVLFEDGVKYIGREAFCLCSSLTDIIMPISIENIEESAFLTAGNLIDVWYSGTEADRDKILVGPYDDLTEAVWHYNTCNYDNHIYSSNCDINCNNCEWIRESTYPHVYGDEVVRCDNYIYATCLTDGSHEEYTLCTLCGAESFGVTVVDEKTGHNFIDCESFEGTCSSNGRIAYKYCSDCWSYFASDETDIYSTDYLSWDDIYSLPINPENHYYNSDCDTICGYCGATRTATVGHTLVDREEQEATCSWEGAIAHKACENCYEWFAADEEDAFSADYLSWEDVFCIPINPENHSYSDALDTSCDYCGEVREILSWTINVDTTGVYNITPNNTLQGFTTDSITVFDDQENIVKYNDAKLGWPLVAGQSYTVKLNSDFDNINNLTWNLTKRADTIFTDTASSEKGGWYNDAVTYSVGAGLITGYGGTDKFGTADNIQRQDFVVILARLAGVDLDNYVSSGNYSFVDVPSGAYYEKAIMWAADVGITTGYAGGTVFGVGDKITREQLVTFLYRYAKYTNGGVAPTVSADAEQKAKTYADYNGVTGYAKEAIIWAIDKGVIKGQGGTHIAPAGNALRCEIAQIMYNIYLNDIFK